MSMVQTAVTKTMSSFAKKRRHTEREREREREMRREGDSLWLK